MNSGKVWYWVAAGVLAMGLTADYRAGQAQWAHRLVEGAQTVAENAHARTAKYVAVAELMLGGRPVVAQAHPGCAAATFTVQASPGIPIAVARQLSLERVNLRRAVIHVRQSFAHESFAGGTRTREPSKRQSALRQAVSVADRLYLRHNFPAKWF